MGTPAQRLEALLASVDSSSHEAEVQRNPYSVRAWVGYLEAKNEAPFVERRLLYERALRLVPLSYKLWRMYLEEVELATRERWASSGRAKVLVRTYERCLLHLHKMPRIWLEYVDALAKTGAVTEVRHAFDRALKALPITQHERIWTLYVAFAKSCPVKEKHKSEHAHLVTDPEDPHFVPNGWKEVAARFVHEGDRALL